MNFRQLTTLSLGLLIAFTAAEAAAQLPDFSGDWTVSSVRGSQRGAQRGRRGARAGRGRTRNADSGSGWGREFTIEQNDELLTVVRDLFVRADLQPPVKVRFALDGSTVLNEILMGRGIQRQETTAAWDGERLVLTTTHFFQPADGGEPVPYDVVQTLALESEQDEEAQQLVIETRIDPLPGTDAEAKNTRSTFTRK